MFLLKPRLHLALWTFALTLATGCASFHSPLQDGLSVPGASNNATPAAGDASATTTAENSPNDGARLFDWPVDDARLSRGFLPRKRHPHLGIDLAAKRGTPILASIAGTVIYTGREFRGYGKMVMIESPQGWATLYAHMDKILVQEGQKIGQGQIIGAIGRTGHATGYHLHFEIRKDRGPVDPLPLLPSVAHMASTNKSSTGSN